MNKSINFSGQPIISQVLKFIPASIIARTAKKHRSDRYYKRFKTYDHLVTMIFATLSGSSSLREVSSIMLACEGKINHLGLSNYPKRSTLSVLNKTPLVETHWDSDYWITFDGITFKIPIYSVLSWFNDKAFKDPIPVGTRIITLNNLDFGVTNLAGYTINKATCWDCPYTPRLLGTYTRYSYSTKQQFFLDQYMVGDTLRIMVKATFNTDLGPREVVEKKFDIIVDK